MACWSTSSAWMLLPLLLVLFHTCRPLPYNNRPDNELETQIKKLGEVVESCTLHCNIVDISNKNCHFLNLTEFCGSHRYFISGVKLYNKKLIEHPSEHCTMGRLNFPHLIGKLNATILIRVNGRISFSPSFPRVRSMHFCGLKSKDSVQNNDQNSVHEASLCDCCVTLNSGSQTTSYTCCHHVYHLHF